MKTWKTRILVSFALSAASVSGFAAPAAGSVQPTPSFQEIDTDGSGFIEKDELGSIAGLDMQTADADNDGKISEEEFAYAKRNVTPTGSGMNLPGKSQPNVPGDTGQR